MQRGLLQVVLLQVVLEGPYCSFSKRTGCAQHFAFNN